MEPTALSKRDLDIMKRQSVGNTWITYGESQILYGTINPCTIFSWGIYRCSETGCDPTTPLTYSSNYAFGSRLQTEEVNIVANGQYNGGYDMRNGLFAAINTAASIGQTWSEAPYDTPYPCTKTDCEVNSLWMGSGVDYIGAASYAADDGGLLGQITIANSAVYSDNPLDCNDFIGDVSAAVSTLDPVWSYAIGLLSAVCQ
jgi:hypothetical protein